MLRDELFNCISLFRPYKIISSRSLFILLLAGIIVLNAKLIHFLQVIPWTSIAKWLNQWYGLIAVVIVILAVSTRSPLVDRIRARDEAAKDANRLLTQLYGKLCNVTRSAYKYNKAVEENRTEIIANAVLKATNQSYTWTYGDGLKPRSYGLWNDMPRHSVAKEADELDQACRALADHLAEYRKNGLHTVAHRLTKRVFSSLYECRIMFDIVELNVHLRMDLASSPKEEIPQFKSLWEAMAGAERDPDTRKQEELRRQADDSVRNYACNLDGELASVYVTLFHLNHISTFLNRRLHGTTTTRFAGSFVR